MKTSGALAIFLLLTLVTSSVAGEVPGRLAKAEATAVRDCSKELLKLARFCVRRKCYDDARAQLERGLALTPDSKSIKRELEKLTKSGNTDDAEVRLEIQERRDAAVLVCAKKLGRAALSHDKGGFEESYSRILAMFRVHFPDGPWLASFDLTFRDPPGRWIRTGDARKYADGWRFIDDEFASPERIAELDKVHAVLDNPWVMSDGVHELHSNLSLLESEELLAKISSFRKHLIAELSEGWELRIPDKPLPVYVTRNFNDLRALAQGFGASLSPLNPGAYLRKKDTVGPFLFTAEFRTPGGLVIKGDEWLAMLLQHELTHQVLSEMSKYDAGSGTPPGLFRWVSEGIAEYATYFRYRDGKWQFTRPDRVRTGVGAHPSAFLQIKTHFEELTPLPRFLKRSPSLFDGAAYQYAAVLTDFLLNAAEGRYRKQYLNLLEAVHKGKATRNAFDVCFQGVDMEALTADWTVYVEILELEAIPDREQPRGE